MWYALSLLALILLFVLPGRSAIGGGMTLGAIAGIIAALVYKFRGGSFEWSIVGKWVVAWMLIGAAIEIASRAFGQKK